MDFRIFILIIEVLLVLFAFGIFWGVIWMPTRKKDYERIAKMAILKSDDVFYDLGSGTGDLLFYLEKNHGIRCVGIEISPIFYFYSKIKSLFYKKVKIRYGNFFKHDISEADILYAFLHPKMYKKLKAKIKKDAKKGVRIILAVWPFSNESQTMSSCEKGEVSYYLYKGKRVVH
ncbi:MAG: hypothetical protein KJI70_02530 [Patescibacteria group bacterium]|nr:hypothetical protein [Patescibacteria group bacterium]